MDQVAPREWLSSWLLLTVVGEVHPLLTLRVARNDGAIGVQNCFRKELGWLLSPDPRRDSLIASITMLRAKSSTTPMPPALSPWARWASSYGMLVAVIMGTGRLGPGGFPSRLPIRRRRSWNSRLLRAARFFSEGSTHSEASLFWNSEDVLISTFFINRRFSSFFSKNNDSIKNDVCFGAR